MIGNAMKLHPRGASTMSKPRKTPCAPSRVRSTKRLGAKEVDASSVAMKETEKEMQEIDARKKIEFVRNIAL